MVPGLDIGRQPEPVRRRRRVIAVRGEPVWFKGNVILAVRKPDGDLAIGKRCRSDGQIIWNFGDADHPLPVLGRPRGRIRRVVTKPDGVKPMVAIVGIGADKQVAPLSDSYGCDHDVPLLKIVCSRSFRPKPYHGLRAVIHAMFTSVAVLLLIRNH